MNPYTHDHDIWRQESTQTSLYDRSTAGNTVRYLEPFTRGSPVCQTDRQNGLFTTAPSNNFITRLMYKNSY